jgi:hypothetical protein
MCILLGAPIRLEKHQNFTTENSTWEKGKDKKGNMRIPHFPKLLPILQLVKKKTK